MQGERRPELVPEPKGMARYGQANFSTLAPKRRVDLVFLLQNGVLTLNVAVSAVLLLLPLLLLLPPSCFFSFSSSLLLALT